MWEELDTAERERRVSILKERSNWNDREVSAKAHLFLGCWYDSLGLTEQATNAYLEAIREIRRDEQDPRQDPLVLEKWATKGRPTQRLLVASNPSTPLQGLLSLKSTSDDDIQANLAMNPRCPTEWLAEFATSSEWRIRSIVAEHPLTPLECLNRLAKDPDQAVRTLAACNYSITSEIAEELSSDAWSGCRWGIARNIATSRDVLKKLLGDDDPSVAVEAQENLAGI